MLEESCRQWIRRKKKEEEVEGTGSLVLVTRVSTFTSAGKSQKWQGEIAGACCIFAAAIVTGWTREFSVALRDLSLSPLAIHPSTLFHHRLSARFRSARN